MEDEGNLLERLMKNIFRGRKGTGRCGGGDGYCL